MVATALLGQNLPGGQHYASGQCGKPERGRRVITPENRSRRKGARFLVRLYILLLVSIQAIKLQVGDRTSKYVRTHECGGMKEDARRAIQRDPPGF